MTGAGRSFEPQRAGDQPEELNIIVTNKLTQRTYHFVAVGIQSKSGNGGGPATVGFPHLCPRHVPLFSDRTNVLCFLICRTRDFLLRQHPEPSAFLALTQCSRGQSSSLAAWLLVSVWVTSFLFAFSFINNTTHLLTNKLYIISWLFSFQFLPLGIMTEKAYKR